MPKLDSQDDNRLLDEKDTKFAEVLRGEWVLSVSLYVVEKWRLSSNDKQ